MHRIKPSPGERWPEGPDEGITGTWKEILSRTTIILFWTAMSILLVTGGQLTTLEYYLSNEWTEAAYLEALVLSLTALLWHQLHLLNRQDRGME